MKTKTSQAQRTLNHKNHNKPPECTSTLSEPGVLRDKFQKGFGQLFQSTFAKQVCVFRLCNTSYPNRFATKFLHSTSAQHICTRHWSSTSLQHHVNMSLYIPAPKYVSPHENHDIAYASCHLLLASCKGINGEQLVQSTFVFLAIMLRLRLIIVEENKLLAPPWHQVAQNWMNKNVVAVVAGALAFVLLFFFFLFLFLFLLLLLLLLLFLLFCSCCCSCSCMCCSCSCSRSLVLLFLFLLVQKHLLLLLFLRLLSFYGAVLSPCWIVQRLFSNLHSANQASK